MRNTYHTLGIAFKSLEVVCVFAYYWSFYLFHYNYFGAFMFANDITGTKDLGDHFAIGIILGSTLANFFLFSNNSLF